MATIDMTASHPVLKHLSDLLTRVNPILEQSSLSFRTCLAITKTKTRCGRHRSQKHQCNAMAFLDEVRGMDKWPDSEDFIARIETFLIDGCCTHHFNESVADMFATWKTDVLPALRSSSETAKASISDGNTNNTSIGKSDVIMVEHRVIGAWPAEDVAIEPVVTQLGALSVSATRSSTDPIASPPANEVKITGLGMAALCRKGSVRDGSMVIREMYTPLTPRQLEKGIVYILKDATSDNLFKIGYTSTTATNRLKQSQNCLKANPNVTIMYESQGGPFFAAHKAEKLAQTVLKNHNLHVRECEICKGGHREWFQASETMVLEAVQAMEQFIRFPAYEQTADGTWKLSDPVHQAVQGLCRLDLQKLVGALFESDAGVTTQAMEQVVPRDTLKAVSVDAAPVVNVVSVSDDHNDSLASQASDLPEHESPASPGDHLAQQESKKSPRRSLGTRAAVAGKMFVKTATTIRSQSGQTLRRWRSGTPDPDSSQHDASQSVENVGNRDPANSAGDVIVGVLWSLMPGDVKEREAEARRVPILQRGVSFATKMKQNILSQFEDYQREWNREEEDRRAAVSSY